MLAAFLCLLTAYLPPGTAGIEHLCLIYHGKRVRPAWTAQSLRRQPLFQVVEFETYER